MVVHCSGGGGRVSTAVLATAYKRTQAEFEALGVNVVGDRPHAVWKLLRVGNLWATTGIPPRGLHPAVVRVDVLKADLVQPELIVHACKNADGKNKIKICSSKRCMFISSARVRRGRP